MYQYKERGPKMSAWVRGKFGDPNVPSGQGGVDTHLSHPAARGKGDRGRVEQTFRPSHAGIPTL